MRRHLLKVLLLIAGAVLTIFLFFRFGFDAIIVPWFWSVEDTAFIVGKTLVLRRLIRPVRKIILRFLIIAFIGYRTAGIVRQRIVRPVHGVITRSYAWWMSVHGIWRALAELGMCVFAAAIVWTTYRIALVPLLWFVVAPLYYALGDLGLDEWTARFRIRYRIARFTHHNRVARMILRRPRHELATAYERLRRLRERRAAEKDGKQ